MYSFIQEKFKDMAENWIRLNTLLKQWLTGMWQIVFALPPSQLQGD